MKKQLLAGVLSATMVMASMPTTAMAVDAPEKATNSLPGKRFVKGVFSTKTPLFFIKTMMYKTNILH